MLQSNSRRMLLRFNTSSSVAALIAQARPPCSTSSSSSLISCTVSIGPSSQLFSTQASSLAPRKKITPDRLDKIERKRSLKAQKRTSQERKLQLHNENEIARSHEREFKRVTSEELAADLPPITDSDLEAIYVGLISAPPSEFAPVPALAGPSDQALLLPDPNSASSPEARQASLNALAERLERFELVEQGTEAREEDGERKNEGGLAEKLRRNRVGDMEGSVVEDDSPKGLLDRLEEMIGSMPSSTEGSANAGGVEPARGLIHKSEWRDLILTSADEGDLESVKRGLSLMQRMTPLADAQILTDLMAVFAEGKRPRDALDLAHFAKEHSLPLSVVSHHHLLSSLVPSHPELALQHLHSIEEAGYTPLLSTYTLVVSRLLSPTSPPHLVSRGWDLYAHCRLVSHPIPDVNLYTTMIMACARGAHPAPERAIDLFTEMTETNEIAPTAASYNALIRACTREGSHESYFEGLRYMKQMLDLNLWPNRGTFHAALEGARRHGDLARARWMLVKMIELGGEASPDASTLALVFRTYKAYEPEVKEKRGGVPMKVVEVDAGTKVVEQQQPDANAPVSVSAPKPASTPSSTPPPPIGEPNSIDLLGDSSFFYPGPLPASSDELVAEARYLLLQCVEPSALSPSEPVRTTSSSFPDVHPTPFLLNSYLELLTSHAPFPACVDFFDSAYNDSTGVEKNGYTYEIMLRRCETAKHREVGLEVARKVFDEWKTWSEADEQRLSGKSISNMWKRMIRVLARSFKHVEGLSLLQGFISTYPPLALVASARVQRVHRQSLPPHPNRIQLSSASFPETTRSSATELPPHILWDDIRLLYLRFQNVEDEEATKVIKGVTKAYGDALREAQRIEEDRPRSKENKNKKEVKRQALM